MNTSSFNIPDKVAELIENEEWAFFHQFRRCPDQFDPLFFDPEEEEIPLPMPTDQLKAYLREVAQRLEMKPSHIYAFFCAAREPDVSRRWFVYSEAIEYYRFLNIPKQ